MAICKDPSITFLNKFGYNVIKLPRKGIEPLDIVGKDKNTEWLGKLSSVWKGTLPEPAPSAPQPAADVQGRQSDKLQLSVGLKVLENALAAFGATAPGLTGAYSRARAVQFTFTNVTSTVVPPLDAGNYLAGGDLNTNNGLVSHYFVEGDARAYLIFDVLKSDSVTVTATDEHNEELAVDVPNIQAMLGAKVGVTAGGSKSSDVTYKGQFAVSFGFRALEIKFENGKWKLEGAKASGDIAFGAPVGGGAASPRTSTDLEPVLLQSNGMLSL